MERKNIDAQNHSLLRCFTYLLKLFNRFQLHTVVVSSHFSAKSFLDPTLQLKSSSFIEFVCFSLRASPHNSKT